MKTHWSPDKYLAALRFATQMHQGQTVPGTDWPYIVHPTAVAMEVMTAIAAQGGCERPDLAVQCALLHDVIEDTPATAGAVAEGFGAEVAAGVLALTKDKSLPSKQAQMADSLARIRQQPRAVWLVKLADRITNLAPPPHYWSREKIADYHREAGQIYAALHSADEWLARRLQQRMDAYRQFFE